jgi:hypothetical protein
MITIGFDVTHANIGSLPPGQQYAGYSTGSPDIRWTDADWAAHPGALRIDQDPVASDGTADYLDVERGAATNAVAAGWYRRALINWRAGNRPGQRWPGIYTSQENVTPLVNALIAGGVTSGPKLIIAHWGLPELEPILELAAASGPFPIVGMQVLSTAQYDLDLFSAAWLAGVSRPAPVVPPLKAQIVAGLAEAAQDVAELVALARRLP